MCLIYSILSGSLDISALIRYKGSTGLTTILDLISLVSQVDLSLESKQKSENPEYNLIYEINMHNLSIEIDYMEVLQLFRFIELIVTVSLLILNYSKGYLDKESTKPRFNIKMLLFIANMLMYVLSDNLLILFVSWEMLGLISALLVVHWFNSTNSVKSSLKAMFVNRIGDYGLSIVIFYLGYNLHFNNIDNIPDIIQLCLVLAVISKSAQVFLHFWLPDAMSAPTPVSSLLHAATMVTAGLYLLVKFNAYNNQLVFIVLINLSAISMLYAGLISGSIFDIKRVVAFSTCSQLAIISLALCNHYIYSALYHLYCHALFKALLFLACGSIIHSLNDNQDIRKFGNLVYNYPLTYVCLLIAAFGLSSVPFTASFYSKDNILDCFVNAYNCLDFFSWTVILMAITLTVYYALYPIRYLADNSSNYISSNLLVSTDTDWNILYVLISFAILSCLFPIFFVVNPELPGNLINYWVQFVPLFIVIVMFMYYEFQFLSFQFYVSEILSLKYLFDLFGRASLNFNSVISYTYTFKLFDKGFFFQLVSSYLQYFIYKVSLFSLIRNFNLNVNVFGFLILIIFSFCSMFIICI